jgi:hypothetical protein
MRYVVHIMQSAPVSDDDHVCECVYCDMDITALLHTSACMVKICSAQRANSALMCGCVCTGNMIGEGNATHGVRHSNVKRANHVH